MCTFHSGTTTRGNLSRVAIVVVCLSTGLLTFAHIGLFVCILMLKQRLFIHCIPNIVFCAHQMCD